MLLALLLLCVIAVQCLYYNASVTLLQVYLQLVLFPTKAARKVRFSAWGGTTAHKLHSFMQPQDLRA
jgi:hypothetical protein